MVNFLLTLPRPIKRIILLVADLIAALLCLYIALFIRHGHADFFISAVWFMTYAVLPIVGLYVIGFYKGVARVFFESDMRKVLQLFVVLLIVFLVLHFIVSNTGIPRSVPFIFLFLLLIWLWNSRLIIRELLTVFTGKSLPRSSEPQNADNVIIYGAGDAGKLLYEALKNSNSSQVVAFIDDDPHLAYAHIMGKKIYPSDKLGSLIDKYGNVQIFMAMPSVNRSRRRQIIEEISSYSVRVKELPSIQDIADGKVTVSTMRRVDIVDVLDRQTVEPVAELLHKDIKNKAVLITGAGGSIGSELCRQAIKHQPRCLILFELSEYALYSIHQELINFLATQSQLNSIDQDIELIKVLGNVNDESRIRSLCQHYHVDTIYHAAAYKHVPIVEHNPFEGVINNTKGTYHCLKAAIDAKVKTFVLISTDKAVRPTNVMGASKRMAELVCQAFSQSQSATRISMVRFGNVLGSSGSVVPLFTKQIEQGGPITVTHPEVTRYFMTIPEAANLVIQAGAMAKGGEVFVLDMGDPVKIVDLARRMIHLSGFEIKDEHNPNADIEIVFTGLRDGEKLYEELIIGEDNVESTQHPLIMQAVEKSYPLIEIERMVSELDIHSQSHNNEWLKQQLLYFVDGYKPASLT